MQDAARYRVFAEECRELANRMNGENREKLQRIAEAWEECAKELDGIEAVRRGSVPR